MKYLFTAKSKTEEKWLLKVHNGTKETWLVCTEAVHNYAKKSIKKNDDVETVEEGGVVTKISKVGGTTTTTAPAATTGPTCEDCGAPLKNPKYKKCFTCNKKNPAKTETKTFQRSPEVQDSIKRQAVMKAAADAVATAMQGQVGDVGTLGEMIVALYKKLLPEV